MFYCFNGVRKPTIGKQNDWSKITHNNIIIPIINKTTDINTDAIPVTYPPNPIGGFEWNEKYPEVKQKYRFELYDGKKR